MGEALDDNVATKAALTEFRAVLEAEMVQGFKALYKPVWAMAAGIVSPWSSSFNSEHGRKALLSGEGFRSGLDRDRAVTVQSACRRGLRPYGTEIYDLLLEIPLQ